MKDKTRTNLEFLKYPLILVSCTLFVMAIFFNVTTLEKSSITIDFPSKKYSVTGEEEECNQDNSFATIETFSVCQGEDWSLPPARKRSDEGRLIMRGFPLVESGSKNERLEKSPSRKFGIYEEIVTTTVINSPDWHGYEIGASWSEHEGDISTKADNCHTSSCSFSDEPTVQEYLFRGGINEGASYKLDSSKVKTVKGQSEKVAYSLAYGLYKITERACVAQCREDTEVEESYCTTSSCCTTDDLEPWIDIINPESPLHQLNQKYGTCLKDPRDEDFTPMTHIVFTNTTAGHNGSYSPNWPGKLGVPTIFEEFETWCEADRNCDLKNVNSAYKKVVGDDEDDCADGESTDSNTGFCENYRDLYDNFEVIKYDIDGDEETDDKIYENDNNINKFLTQRRKYSYETYQHDDGNVYAFANNEYIEYQCRFFQRVLATIDKLSENYQTPFSMYLNAEAGNLATVPNTIYTIGELDLWARKVIDNALKISNGIQMDMLFACDLDKHELDNLSKYLGDARSIWTANVNGVRAAKEWGKLAVANRMGLATHGETAVFGHQFLQFMYPFIQYDEDSYTFKSCLNAFDCESYLPDNDDPILDAKYPPFDIDSWEDNVVDGKRPFSHTHIDMTYLHKDINTTAQYRQFRISALTGLALGVNQILLDAEQVAGQGNWQSENCTDKSSDKIRQSYSCEERKNHEDSDGAKIDLGSNNCNIKWDCIKKYDPYSFVKWIGKNIGTNSKTTPEAYCNLASSGTQYIGAGKTWYERIKEIWDDRSWEMLNEDTGIWSAQYNGNQNEAIRNPYIGSMGRFCSLDYENGRGARSRNFLSYYGDGSPAFETFPLFNPYEARSTDSSQSLLFKLDSSFVEANTSKVEGYAIKVIFSAGDAITKGIWNLSYYDDDSWNTLQAVSFDPATMDDDIYTATFYIDDLDFLADGDENDNHLKISSVLGADAQFLLIRIIPIYNSFTIKNINYVN